MRRNEDAAGVDLERAMEPDDSSSDGEPGVDAARSASSGRGKATMALRQRFASPSSSREGIYGRGGDRLGTEMSDRRRTPTRTSSSVSNGIVIGAPVDADVIDDYSDSDDDDGSLVFKMRGVTLSQVESANREMYQRRLQRCDTQATTAATRMFGVMFDHLISRMQGRKRSLHRRRNRPSR